MQREPRQRALREGVPTESPGRVEWIQLTPSAQGKAEASLHLNGNNSYKARHENSSYITLLAQIGGDIASGTQPCKMVEGGGGKVRHWIASAARG